jgi:hypothetical protein
VQHAVVLDIGEGPDADLVHVAPQYGIHPYGSVLAEYNVPDDLCRLIDKTSRRNCRPDAFIRSNHALSENIEHSTSCELRAMSNELRPKSEGKRADDFPHTPILLTAHCSSLPVPTPGKSVRNLLRITDSRRWECYTTSGFFYAPTGKSPGRAGS